MCCANPMWGNSPSPSAGCRISPNFDQWFNCLISKKEQNKYLIRTWYFHHTHSDIGSIDWKKKKAKRIFYLPAKMRVRDNYLFESPKLWYNKSFVRFEGSSLHCPSIILPRRGRGWEEEEEKFVLIGSSWIHHQSNFVILPLSRHSSRSTQH